MLLFELSRATRYHIRYAAHVLHAATLDALRLYMFTPLMLSLIITPPFSSPLLITPWLPPRFFFDVFCFDYFHKRYAIHVLRHASLRLMAFRFVITLFSPLAICSSCYAAFDRYAIAFASCHLRRH